MRPTRRSITTGSGAVSRGTWWACSAATNKRGARRRSMDLLVNQRNDDVALVYPGLRRGRGVHGAAQPDVHVEVRRRPEATNGPDCGIEHGAARRIVRGATP